MIGIGKAALERLRHPLLKEEHVWYELALDGAAAKVATPAGVELVKATEAEIPLAVITGKDPDQTRARLAEGYDLWLMVEGQKAAFSCWVYRGRTPMLAAKGGWLILPEGIVCLEDSATNPEFRGRGIAPAAWGAIADALHREGLSFLVTKVEVENAPSRKACLKAGFAEIGLMRLNQLGPIRRAGIAEPTGATGRLLADSLAG
jgi:GNAT superfamily N-acetyltransferase